MKKLDLKFPVKTRDGLPVRILCTDAQLSSNEEIIGICDNMARTWFSNGRYLEFSGIVSSDYDLMPNVEVITLDEVITNASANFSKLQCIAGPLNFDGNNVNGEGTRCVIGWSLTEPEKYPHLGIAEIANRSDGSGVIVAEDEVRQMSNLQIIHDYLCLGDIPLSVRSAVMISALDLAKAKSLDASALNTLGMIARAATV